MSGSYILTQNTEEIGLSIRQLSLADIALLCFTATNSVRVFAYLPQIASVARDRSGAGAISCTTWRLFAASHLSTVAYALLALQDWRMAAVFGANTACCAAILALTVLRRVQFRRGIPGRGTTSEPPQVVLKLGR